MAILILLMQYLKNMLINSQIKIYRKSIEYYSKVFMNLYQKIILLGCLACFQDFQSMWTKKA